MVDLVVPVVGCQVGIVILKVGNYLIDPSGLKVPRFGWCHGSGVGTKEHAGVDVYVDSPVVSVYSNLEWLVATSFHGRQQLRICQDVVDAFVASDICLEGVGVCAVLVVMDIYEIALVT